MRKSSSTLLSLARLGRPYYVLPAVATAAAGAVANSATGALTTRVATVGLVFGLIGMASWTANEIADRDSDARGSAKSRWGIYVSGGTGLLATGVVSVRAATRFTLLLSAVGILAAASLGLAFALLSTAFLAIGLVYSLRPIRLKARGVVGLATVALAHGIVAFSAGWMAGGARPLSDCLVPGGILAVLYFGFEGVAHLLDEKNDRESGVITTAVSLGQQRTRVVLACCQCLPGLALLAFNDINLGTLLGIRFAALVLLATISIVAAVLTARSASGALSSLRVLGVPIICAFAFVVV
ncbi:MAG: UbiA family prenyltransferase [Patescibacteria group bacterium]